MNKKKNTECHLRDGTRRWDKQILTDLLHSGTMCVKRKRETDGAFLLHDVYENHYNLEEITILLDL